MRARPGEDGLDHREASFWLRPPVCGAALLAAAALASAWYARLGLPFQDEGGMLALASRILRGEVFYRDLDAYALPGASYLLAACLALFGDHLDVARTLAGALFCGSLLALYAAALAVLDRRSAAIFGFSLLTWKLLAWPMGTSFVHGDVAYFFAWLGIACLLHAIRGETPGRGRLAAAGAAIAGSLLCRQNVGLYLAAAAVLLLLAPGAWRARPSLAAQRGPALAAFGAGLGLPLAAAATGFAAQGVLPAMLWSGFVRPFTGYLETSAVPYAPMLAWWQLGSLQDTGASSYLPLELWRMLKTGRLPGEPLHGVYWMLTEILSRALYSAAPLAFGWVALRRLRGADSGSDAVLYALAALALAALLAAFPRADVLHVLPALPPTLLVLYALWRRTAGGWRLARHAEVALLLCAVGTSAALAVRSASFLTLRLELARADVWVAPPDAWIEPVVEAARRTIAPDEPFFVYGNEAQLYYLADRFSPWPFVWLYPGMEGGDGGRALAAALRRDPPKLVVQGMLALPGLPDLPAYTPEVQAFLRHGYAADESFFERHPSRGPRPPPRLARVLRPREGTR